MIEVRKNRDPTSRREYQLFIDGALMDKVYVSGGHEYFHITARDRDSSRKLASYSLSEFPPLEYLSIRPYLDVEHIDNIAGVFIGRERENAEDMNNYYVTLQIGGRTLSEWKEAYIFQAYAFEFFKTFKVIDDSVVVDLLDPEESPLNWEVNLDGDKPYWTEISLDEIDKGALYTLSVKFNYSSPRVIIADELVRIRNIIGDVHKDVVSRLALSIHSDSVTVSFDFPEEVRVPCEQYLLYFAQFLRDLGVRADTALTHEAGQVLFTVTPADKEQALDKIRAALDAYLHLPANPVSDAAGESVALQRLEASVLRLRSDLKLAAAELQAKNTTIEAQQLIIDTQKGLLSGEIILNSMKDVTPRPKDEDKEEVLGGVVSIIPVQGKGVEINLPELFRRLKRLFTEE